MKIQTINPATKQILNEYDYMTKQEILDTLSKSKTAFESWKELTYDQRKKYFSELSEFLEQNKEEYAKLMTNEMGKPIKESIAEVKKCAHLSEFISENAEPWLQPEKFKADGKEHLVRFDPLGPILLIMPWNFPFWQVFKVALPPLFAGNTIILKHAKNVTGTALKINEIFERIFPKNVFRTVVSDHETINELISKDELVGVSLTGSVSAGKRIAAQAGKYLKKTVMELGGSDPLIVLEDADIKKAAKGAVLGRTLNGGQVCIASKRIIVHKNIEEEFKKEFVEEMKKLKIGDPLDYNTDIGPLANENAVKDMENFVENAVNLGARILTGGKRLKREGFFFEPTILDSTTPEMDAVCLETFGPVAPIIIADSNEEAIVIANNS
ncbi:aldehyde dehydrogenase family protein, partial [archaeon]|nr:aldehyde dehydrogenase family protein [archaeon]